MSSLRPMRDTDRTVVLDIIHATGFFTPAEEQVATELIDIYLTQPCQRDYLIDVAENAHGRVTGYVCYGPTALTEGTYDLYWMAVAPPTQRQGLGKILVTHVEDYVRRQKGRLLIIETSSQDKYHSTRSFYERQGYAEKGRIPHFYRNGDDRVIYCKYFQPEGPHGRVAPAG